jgi:hypothetical protein
MPTMKIKIHGGTARQDDPSLCLSCRYASIVAGTSAQHQIIRCGKIEARVTFQVTACTEYLHRQHPSLWHMEDIAWVLRTDAKRKQIGFVRSKDLKVRERFVLDEE